MAFTVDDYLDLLRMLSDHPEWRIELRRALIPDDFATLPDVVRRLAEAQERSEERMGRLENALARLAEAQERSEERMGRLEAVVTRLAEAQERADRRLERLETRVGHLDGRELERHYREAAPGIFGQLIRRARALTRDALADLLEDALPPKEAADAVLLDVVVRGRLPGDGPTREVFLAGEVSLTLDRGDVQRAVRRSRLIRRAGYHAIPVIAGEAITPEADEAARAEKVLVVQDGRTLLWDEALEAWPPPSSEQAPG